MPEPDDKAVEPEFIIPDEDAARASVKPKNAEAQVIEPEVVEADGPVLDKDELKTAAAAHGPEGPPVTGKPREPMVIDIGPTLPARRRNNDLSLAARDPLQAYMAEISRYELLTPEEEKELAREYQDAGNEAAAYKLVTANLRLVAKIAFKYRRFYKNVLDLIQEGNIGLMKAVQKYDPYRGVRLSTYARYWIQAYIMYFLLANHRIVKVGTTQAKRKLFYNLNKETKRLREMGFDPTPERIAASLDVDVKDVVEMQQRLSSPDASLEAPVGDEDDRTLGSTLPSGDAGPEAPVEYGEMMSMIGGAMRAFGETLTNEREVVIWHQRLMTEDPITLQEIGDRFGITRERARQIEAKMKKRLKAWLLEKLGDEVELSVELIA
jgi:RNA polymerase sigma-32 factor